MTHFYPNINKLGKLLKAKYTMQILELIYDEPKRFNQLEKDVNSTTLSNRLNELSDLKLIQQKEMEGKREYHVYQLTPTGKQLFKNLKKLEKQISIQRKEKDIEAYPDIKLEIKK